MPPSDGMDWWRYVGAKRGLAPVPGFPVEDASDAELQAAAETYAGGWPEGERPAVEDVLRALTARGRGQQYRKGRGEPPAGVLGRVARVEPPVTASEAPAEGAEPPAGEEE